MALRKKHLTPLIAVAAAAALYIGYRPDTVVGDTHRDRQNNEWAFRENNNDQAIANGIKALLKEEPGLSEDARNVKVVTNKGNVFLRGNVVSPAEEMKVLDIARRVSTNAKIDNDLVVRSPASTVVE